MGWPRLPGSSQTMRIRERAMIAQALAIGGAFFGGMSQSMAKRGVQSLTPTHFLAVKWGASGAFFTLVALATQAWRDFQWNEGMVAILAASIVAAEPAVGHASGHRLPGRAT